MIKKSKKKSERKKKQEATLARMKKTRQIDSDHLRTIIQQKLKWAQIEKEKGLKIIEANKKIILQLDGIILFIKDLLEPED